MEETITAKIERYYDMALGFTTKLVQANPRKAAVGVMILSACLLLSLCTGD